MARPKTPLKKLIAFYVRFTPSYSKIGFHARSLTWSRFSQDFSGRSFAHRS